MQFIILTVLSLFDHPFFYLLFDQLLSILLPFIIVFSFLCLFVLKEKCIDVPYQFSRRFNDHYQYLAENAHSIENGIAGKYIVIEVE